MERELTVKEKREIKQLIINECANYDNTLGCLITNGECPMMLKCYNKCICRYFVESILPAHPTVAAIFETDTGNIKKCKYCGKTFKASGKKACCSEKCTKLLANKKAKMRMRKQREK